MDSQVAFEYVEDDRAPDNMLEKLEDRSTCLPGYGMSVTASRSSKGFPTALFEQENEPPLLTVREHTMMDMMNRMSDKPGWQSKIFDENITAKWKTEFQAIPDMDISEKMVDESLAELRHKAKGFKTTNSIETLNGVFKSDTIVPEGLRLALIEAVKPLENVPEDQKDWHPGSNDKVLDLVHPSIYPLVYGQTVILPQESTTLVDWHQHYSDGEALQANQDLFGERQWSDKFQWLPCEVDISGNDTKVTSYINNLQPQRHTKIYAIIEKVIGVALPLWNQTLSRLVDIRPPRIILDNYGYSELSEPEPEYVDGDDGWQDAMEEWRDKRPILQPEPKTFDPNTYKEDSIPFDLRSSRDCPDHKIQVIVKLASIYLTPDSPKYDGGSWHVEGAANENICASAIYYYESDNISESLLSFRHHVEDVGYENYDQDDHRALETIYGFENGTSRIQDLGSVVTRQNRMITFPNIMQHRVNPFHLEDPSKPGHRKILALFLVDPHQPIISTANVPPQQAEWWEAHLQLVDQVLLRLPQELRDDVKEHLWQPVGMDVAKQQRLELMDERSALVEQQNRDIEYQWGQFDLCEH